MSEVKKWTKKELQEHIKINIWVADEGYSAAVVAGALYKKLYDEYPKIGLSGFQAEAIDSIVKVMPEVSNN